MKKENIIFQSVISEFHDIIRRVSNKLVARDVAFSNVSDKIHVAIGMRRVGKTYLIYQDILQKLEKGTSLNQIIYLNFEDDRLLATNGHQLAMMLDYYYEMHPDNINQTCYIYLDEIQNVSGWSNVVRRFFDTKQVEIYLTGSSAKLLSKEIATSLRGRSLAVDVWPYSLQEYIVATKQSVGEKNTRQSDFLQIKKIFHAYLLCGGFPEVANYLLEDRQRTLQDYVDLVIYRDIVERYKIANPALLKYFILTMLHNVGKSFSVNKFFNDAKSQGYKLSKDSLYEYIAYVEDAYLLFLVPLYSSSIRKVNTNYKKIYAIDTGLVDAVTFVTEKNWGNLFENIVYLELRRQGYQVFYYLTEDRLEVDFVVQNKQGQCCLLQICWNDDNPETTARETRALDQAKQELKLDGKVLTLDEFLREGVNIEKYF